MYLCADEIWLCKLSLQNSKALFLNDRILNGFSF